MFKLKPRNKLIYRNASKDICRGWNFETKNSKKLKRKISKTTV